MNELYFTCLLFVFGIREPKGFVSSWTTQGKAEQSEAKA